MFHEGYLVNPLNPNQNSINMLKLNEILPTDFV